MKKNRIFTIALLSSLSVSLLASPAMASDTATNPKVSLDSASECMDTSYQLQNFINEQKVVHPQSRGVITSPYGGRSGVNPQLPKDHLEKHLGVDYSQGAGTPIYAAASGTVTRAGNEIVGDGQIITIEHKINGKVWTTMYLHVMNATEKVKKGDKVKAGQQIAREGATGNVTGAHLHFEVWEGEYLTGKSTDPVKWLTDMKAVDVSDNSIPNFTCNKGTVFDGKIAAWGGVRNGEIPQDKLTTLDFNPKYTLETEASGKLSELNAAFKEKFNRNIPIVAAYKDLQTQNDESARISGSPLPGMSNFGWGKAITLYYSNPEGGIKPLMNQESYNHFDDIEYKWLLKNAPAYGWINPIINHENNLDPKPERFIFVGVEAANTPPSKDDMQLYARASMIAYNWTDKESLCLNEKWEEVSGWNPKLINGDSIGVAQTSMEKKFGADWKDNPKAKEFASSPRMQIDAGLKDIKDSGKTPCEI